MKITFLRNFEWWGRNPAGGCYLCKVLWSFRAGSTVEAPQEAATAAIAAGAAREAEE